MDESSKRTWDVALAVAGPVITIIGLLAGVWQFTAGERNKVRLENELQGRKDTVEFQRKLWLEKLDAYKGIVILAGKIAAAADQQPGAAGILPPGQEGKLSIEELWRELTAVYWGQKLFMEDDGVSGSLREFYDTVRDLRESWANADKVKVKADALAEACRKALRKAAPPGALT